MKACESGLVFGSIFTLKLVAAFSYSGPACSQSLFILKDIREGLVNLRPAFQSLLPSASDILGKERLRLSG